MKMGFFAFATLAVFLAAPPSFAQVSEMAMPSLADMTQGAQKFENGLELFWQEQSAVGGARASSDPDATIELFDTSRTKLAFIDLTRVIRASDQSSSGVSVYDVSARRPGYIAVAAVYPKTTGAPVALLLLFNWDGSLKRRLVLDKLPQIEQLEIDSSGHIWALNSFDKDDPTDFVFSEFDSSGSLLNRYVRPEKRWSTDESMSRGGQVSFGLIAGQVWAWLPTSGLLVSFEGITGKTIIHKTGLPHFRSSFFVHARRAALLKDGQLLIDVGWRNKARFESGWFLWTASSGWKSMRHNGEAGFLYLYNLDGDNLIFSSSVPTPTSLPTFHSEPVRSLLSSAAFH